MSPYDYLKSAIRQKGCTLQQVADATDMTKGYLSQLINAKIKSPSAQKLEALHRFLGLEFPYHQKSIGVVFGKFYPLHTGHIYLIQRACSQVDELHVVLGYDEPRDRLLFEHSSMSQQPTVSDRLRWLLQTFKYQKNIHIHAFNEQGMEPYPHGWDVWSRGIKNFMVEKGIEPNYVYTSEEQDAPQYNEHLGIDTVLVDPKRSFMNISGAQIRQDPFRYWEYIPTEVKPFFVRTVAILGGESSGKSTLVNKLANIFNTSSAWEYGRDYVFSHLGGDEMALQYSDYDKIALGQAQYIDFAIKYANKVAFIDTDFITTQAFCKKYEGREHPFVQALVEEYRFDLVILLENNTPWVADGLRSLGSASDRQAFQDLLKAMLIENKVSYVDVSDSDYDGRFLRCVELVQNMLGHPHRNQ
ncbi:multifunctional transcriptional regulator/nicotinamide-nucleotide adenylyltransferase/ribosylnicotinamide kinase NadR [Pectobacteriaceae bacterium CE70]|uniref:Multifunctional transcriptional regulator/nicotinamide-nucleotide adenylyltransferase/ribosylnicotinamide kinase NadR n=1 Tax=Serratia sp. (strain ATCC 39006) TaxID=104623 RepID=A0A2I5TCQ2_SERS3|nr:MULTISPECIES: multifunctional transcriptional regulator/nicotinamide-nucleotide adenylyltransferase/ribosylnicotinamide kinase NadR [Enterobacterales]WJV63054.1 multifunctional transcriptional regulator/nicotinamide-nucleotide adenylyltransferase/ribosylnicotinamide kinase NadR [Pectobacteriaceae bacterium C52]WJV67376.1 multifunctional transcriptional regulator/nicotinamide-nucleotide adenylyltransferase/ribosylnicotinamide kinase NadR [Pectobacteriaceae bacterium CE70]WJY11357.1 multifuncti